MTTAVDLTIGATTGITTDLYRSVFRRYAAGVVIVTAVAGGGSYRGDDGLDDGFDHGRPNGRADTSGGRPVGFTATSLASISLEPPLVSFALSTSASSWPAIAEASSVVVNFLDARQRELAERFARSGIDRFAPPTRWSRLTSGEPVLDEAAGYLRGRIRHRYPAGDHHLVVAQVTDAVTRHHEPLVYHAGAFSTVAAGGG